MDERLTDEVTESWAAAKQGARGRTEEVRAETGRIWERDDQTWCPHISKNGHGSEGQDTASGTRWNSERTKTRESERTVNPGCER